MRRTVRELTCVRVSRWPFAQAPQTVECALATALARAAESGRWDVVAQLARELEARRLGDSGNVVQFQPPQGKD